MLEPTWVMLTRLACMMRSLEKLRNGNALSPKSLFLKYTSVPPPLVVWRAMRSGICSLLSFPSRQYRQVCSPSHLADYSIRDRYIKAAQQHRNRCRFQSFMPAMPATSTPTYLVVTPVMALSMYFQQTSQVGHRFLHGQTCTISSCRHY